MTTPASAPEPARPTPIRAAVEAARAQQEEDRAQEAAREEAAHLAETERLADIASIKRAFKKSGLKGATAVGRSLGYLADEVKDILNPPAPPPRSSRDAEADSPDDGGKPPHDEERGPAYELKKKPIKPVPEDCPVRPLGRMGGDFYYLDPLKQFSPVSASDHNANGLRALFGHKTDYLWHNWPKFREPKSATDKPKHTGFKPDECSESLMTACSSLGLFDPMRRIRGRGGWRDEKGGLILHLGDTLIIDGAAAEPDRHGRHIYPAGEPCPRPADSADPALVRALMAQFDTWSWRGAWAHRDGLNATLAASLLTGWIGCGMAGAALDWRPLLWMTGDAATGKSSLQQTISGVLNGFLIEATDASGPSIWQSLKYDCLPVALDEMENEPDTPKNKNIIKLARAAASGGRIMRGSTGGEASYFEARSAFAFSSILIPPMLGQDVTRFCILDLDPLPKEARRRKAEPGQLRATGQAMLRRLIDGWPRFSDTFAAYAEPLIARGHNQRGADVWATLLAMADLMQGGEPLDNDSIAILAGLIDPPAAGATSNALAMLAHLTTTPLDVFRGGTRMTIGELVAIASGHKPSADGGSVNAHSCGEALRSWSIFVDGSGEGARVTLPNQSSGLIKLFAHSQWAGQGGADGAWNQAMRRLSHAAQENSRRLGGRGWSVPARVFLQLDDDTAFAPAPAPPPEWDNDLGPY